MLSKIVTKMARAKWQRIYSIFIYKNKKITHNTHSIAVFV